jgi:hypothetical protein
MCIILYLLRIHPTAEIDSGQKKGGNLAAKWNVIFSDLRQPHKTHWTHVRWKISHASMLERKVNANGSRMTRNTYQPGRPGRPPLTWILGRYIALHRSPVWYSHFSHMLINNCYFSHMLYIIVRDKKKRNMICTDSLHAARKAENSTKVRLKRTWPSRSILMPVRVSGSVSRATAITNESSVHCQGTTVQALTCAMLRFFAGTQVSENDVL